MREKRRFDTSPGRFAPKASFWGSLLMVKLRGSATEYVFQKGCARGTLTIRVDGELVYQKAAGRDPRNPQPTPEEFATVTELVLRRAGATGAVDADEAEAFGAIHDAMTAKLARAQCAPNI